MHNALCKVSHDPCESTKWSKNGTKSEKMKQDLETRLKTRSEEMMTRAQRDNSESTAEETSTGAVLSAIASSNL